MTDHYRFTASEENPVDLQRIIDENSDAAILLVSWQDSRGEPRGVILITPKGMERARCVGHHYGCSTEFRLGIPETIIARNRSSWHSIHRHTMRLDEARERANEWYNELIRLETLRVTFGVERFS